MVGALGADMKKPLRRGRLGDGVIPLTVPCAWLGLSLGTAVTRPEAIFHLLHDRIVLGP